MKHEIIISKSIPDEIAIEMLVNLINKIAAKTKDSIDINFKTNLRIEYKTNNKTIKARILGNI